MNVLCGGGDLVAKLEDALERVKSGELVGVTIIGITSEGLQGWTAAVVDGTPFAWARMVAAAADAQREAVELPLDEWP